MKKLILLISILFSFNFANAKEYGTNTSGFTGLEIVSNISDFINEIIYELEVEEIIDYEVGNYDTIYFKKN